MFEKLEDLTLFMKYNLASHFSLISFIEKNENLAFKFYFVFIKF
jgi:hypothetical protein